MAFLTKWRDDRDVAQSLLHQHSTWLKSFRNQISKVSNIAGSNSYRANR